MPAATPWWVAAFAKDYDLLYAHRDDASAAAEVAGVLGYIGQGPGSVVDVCCGNGRHLQALLQAGVAATGFDYSEALLARCRQRPLCAGRVCRGDIRRPPLAGGQRALLLFFTAFGYFDDAANAETLAALAACLAPDGWLMLDLPDTDALRAGLVPASERQVGDCRIRERRRLTATRVEKDVELVHADGRRHGYTESVRLYDPPALRALAGSVGLEPVERWPSLRGPSQQDRRHVWWLRPVSH